MPIRESYEPGRPCWVDLGTTDPAAARAFYGSLFGWTPEVDARPEAGGYAQFRHDGHAVAGVGPIFTEGMPPTWTTYIATADVDATAAAVAENGGTCYSRPWRSSTPGAWRSSGRWRLPGCGRPASTSGPPSSRPAVSWSQR